MTPLVGWGLDGLPLPMGHVSYVVDPEKLVALAGRDWQFLFSPFFDSLYVSLMVVTAVVTLAGFVAAELIGPIRAYCRGVHNRFLAYQESVPVILRLALGIALVVSGTSQAIYLPNVAGAEAANLEVILGFLLLIGFMNRPCALVALAIYFYGFTKSHYMFGTMETIAAALVIVAFGPARPSADHVLDVDVLGTLLEPLWKRMRQLAPLIVRTALGSTLIWLAITEKAMNPRVSEAVVIDEGLMDVIPVSSAMWVLAVGIIEIAVGTVLFLGFFTRTFSIIAFLVLTLSFFYFKEEVAGHVTFFGSLLVLMITGAGPCSIDSLVARFTRSVSGTTIPYA